MNNVRRVNVPTPANFCVFECFLDLAQNLATASEETVRAFLQSLKDSKSLAAGDLQENVFKNYNEFVTISKEISKLESDMQTLRGLLDDLKTVSDNLVDDDDEFLLTAGMDPPHGRTFCVY